MKTKIKSKNSVPKVNNESFQQSALQLREEYGSSLFNLINKLGITYTSLSSAIGIHPRSLRRIIDAETVPPPAIVNALAKQFQDNSFKQLSIKMVQLYSQVNVGSRPMGSNCQFGATKKVNVVRKIDTLFQVSLPLNIDVFSSELGLTVPMVARAMRKSITPSVVTYSFNSKNTVVTTSY